VRTLPLPHNNHRRTFPWITFTYDPSTNSLWVPEENRRAVDVADARHR